MSLEGRRRRDQITLRNLDFILQQKPLTLNKKVIEAALEWNYKTRSQLGKIEGRRTVDEMTGCFHWLNEHEFEQALGVGDGQGSLAFCSPWGHKESYMTERLEQIKGGWNDGLNWKRRAPKNDGVSLKGCRQIKEMLMRLMFGVPSEQTLRKIPGFLAWAMRQHYLSPKWGIRERPELCRWGWGWAG